MLLPCWLLHNSKDVVLCRQRRPAAVTWRGHKPRSPRLLPATAAAAAATGAPGARHSTRQHRRQLASAPARQSASCEASQHAVHSKTTHLFREACCQEPAFSLRQASWHQVVGASGRAGPRLRQHKAAGVGGMCAAAAAVAAVSTRNTANTLCPPFVAVGAPSWSSPRPRSALICCRWKLAVAKCWLQGTFSRNYRNILRSWGVGRIRALKPEAVGNRSEQLLCPAPSGGTREAYLSTSQRTQHHHQHDRSPTPRINLLLGWKQGTT